MSNILNFDPATRRWLRLVLDAMNAALVLRRAINGAVAARASATSPQASDTGKCQAPHGGIPAPLSPGEVGVSVEGIWQALKGFAGADVGVSKLAVTTMTGLKRTVRRFGPVLGRRDGLRGIGLLDYTTDGDVANLATPLSHAALAARRLTDRWDGRGPVAVG
jgi:hypothetical protein